MGTIDTTALPDIVQGTTPPTFPYLIGPGLSSPYVEYLLNISLHK